MNPINFALSENTNTDPTDINLELGNRFYFVSGTVTNFSNNTTYSQVGLDPFTISIVPPDVNLVVTDITAPATVASGQTFSLSWTVQNQGTTSTNTYYWYDRLVYSTDDIFGNEDDIFLNEFPTDYYFNNLPLDPNETYTITQDITVPNYIAGQGYLLLNTDQYNDQSENDETDNVKSVAINVIPPDVNLVVTDITAPATVASGQTFSLSWTVQNQGQEATNSYYWYDRVVYSTDDIFGNEDDIFLNEFPTDYYFNNLPLDPNETYTNNSEITIPGNIVGEGYLLIKTDSYNSQVETDETDNIKSIPITITPPDVNLVVTEITAPSSVAIGQSFNVFWTVQNQGQEATTSNSWVDSLVYSKDEIFGNEDDIYLGESNYYYGYSGNVEANATYSNNRFITLPTEITESGYLLLKTDPNNNQPETNETDNVKSVAINVTYPQDNLVVTEITVPESPKFGQKISLSWTVQNQGIETTTSSYWNDTVVYSTDEFFGNEDDIYLGGSLNYYYYPYNFPFPDYSTYVPPVNPNETYTITRNITLPTQAPENGYLLVKTDSYNSQPETDETDNVKAVAITLTQPKDNLVVTEITAPTVALPGQIISLAWTVQNQGIDAITASNWTDHVVYSTDDIFGNEDDIYLTESRNRNYIFGSGSYNVGPNDNYVPSLNPNETYTINRSFVGLPSEIIGNGYLLVKTDVNNNQVETDETDNVKAVPITITKPNLVVTDITAPTSVKNGETVAVSWTVQNQGGIATNSSWFSTSWTDSIVYSTDDIFGNEDDVNLPIDFLPGLYSSLAPNESYTTNLNITIPNDIAGQGYLLVTTDVGNSLGETDKTDNVKAIAINVTQPHAPTDIQISNISISENALNNSLVGRFKAVDKNTNDTHTYQLLNPESIPFTVVDNELRVSGKLDYETKTNYQLQVRTTDQDGLSFDKTLTVNIQDDRDFDITGTSGDDIIVGGIGGDLMQGNGGKDIFQYNNYKENGDTIIDFNPINDDRFDLKNLYTNPRINLGTNPFNSYIKVTQLGANTRIDFAPFANLAPNYFLPLATVENVNASQIDSSDFIFI
ncbi:CARDB domain-containing protein [Crocosphaera sp. XPORK-15E]|uniref:CARDB domain-containing protein n=1 Tax=Crocosphaera sp. XPORK-15E TaxID=3110247 RepID=UPI002B1ED5D0|nr:CARDB domain-containing protein [Crocosphaera sp. XPORK-15E]MEA5534013.1 CARDB domain-containing protein [Crocosphaera sp. XPORK-15E]